MLAAVRLSIKRHKEGLLELLKTRLRKDHHDVLAPNKIDTYLNHLLNVVVAVKLTDGETMFSSLTNAPAEITDLTRLGIASSSFTEESDREDLSNLERYVGYYVTERFVAETILLFFEDGEVLERARNVQVRQTVEMLQKVLSSFGSIAPFKGSILEWIVLHRQSCCSRHVKK